MAEVGQRVQPPPGLSIQQLNLFPTACVGLDAAGAITYWNAAASQQFARPAEFAIGRAAADLIAAGDDRERLLDALDALRTGAGIHQCDLQSLLEDGRTVRGGWTLLASTADDGSFAGAMALCQTVSTGDVSPDGIVAEPSDDHLDQPLPNALHSRQEALLNAIPDSLYVINRTGCILEFRPSPEIEHRPFPVDGYVGKYVHEVVEPVRAASISETIADVLATGRPRILEYSVQTPDGPSYREARYVQSGPDTVLALIRNVDARHRAELEREQLLISLDRERRQLDAVIQQLPAMLSIVDADGRVRRVNDEFLEMLGVTAEDVLGRAQGSFPYTIVDEDGRPLATPDLPSVRALKGEHVATEVGVPRPGGMLWFHVLAAPIRNEEGGVDGAVLTMRDLTAERAAADTLRASEAINRALIEAIPDSIYHVDKSGTILRFKPATGLKLPGHLPPDLTGLSIDDTVPPEIARERRAIAEEVLRNGLAQDHKYTLSWGGHETHREARVVKLDAESILCLVRNIDAQVETERELERLLGVVEADRRRLNAVLRQVPNGLLVFDAHGRIVEVNDALANSLGRPKSEIIGDTLPARNPAYFAEDGHRLTPDEIPSARALRGIESTVLVYDDSPGRQVWLEVSAAPIRDDLGAIVGAIVDSRDVTAERAAAQALRASEERNRALLDAIPDALYRVRRDGMVLERRAPEDGRLQLHQVYVGRNLTDLLGLELGNRLKSVVVRALDTGQRQAVEYTSLGNGELLHRETRVVALGPDEVLLVVRDIGERRRAELERERLMGIVEAERRRLDAVFRQAPNGLIVYDADGRIAEINDALAAIMRRPKSEIVGLSAAEVGLFYHDESGRRLEPHELPSARALRGDNVNVELFGGTAAHQVWIQVSAAPIRDDHGVVVGSIVASRNITGEREAAEALRASEERNRALLEAIPDSIYVGGRDGIIVDYKPPGDGRPVLFDDVIGRAAAEIWPPESVNRLMEVVNLVLDTGQTQSIDYLIPTRLGDQYREARVVPCGHEQVLVLVRDVDAQRRAEQERERLLQKIDSERRRLDVILRQLPYALIVLDREGRIEEVNVGFMESTGLSEERIIGKTTEAIPSRLRHPDGRLMEHDELPSVRALAGEEFAGELRIDGPVGRIWWVNVSAGPIRDEHGAITGAIVSTRDVTVEREALEGLKASEARVRALLDAIPDSIYVRDRDGTLLDYKPPGDGRPMQLRPEIGGPLSEMWTGRLGDDILRVTRKVIDTGEPEFMEYQVPTPLGPAYREARVVRSGPNQMLALVRDIDARKRAEQDLNLLNQELEERVQARTAELEAANHELEAFSYSVSHDLKAPLRGIDGYSRLLWEDYQDRLDDDGRVLLQYVRQGAAQMYQLIDDLLAYSRLERRAIDQFEIELLPIVEGLLDERAGEIEARGVHLTVDVPEITVRADRDGLAQAVRNLLENALRFTDAARKPEIAIRAITNADCCILSVRDNGIGFDMAYHDKIFEIFQRLHRAEEYAGTGIGLALVRKAMQRMGGRVWAESTPGSGATFFLELPR